MYYLRTPQSQYHTRLTNNMPSVGVFWLCCHKRYLSFVHMKKKNFTNISANKLLLLVMMSKYVKIPVRHDQNLYRSNVHLMQYRDRIRHQKPTYSTAI